MTVAEQMRKKALTNEKLIKEYDDILRTIIEFAEEGGLYISLKQLSKSIIILLESDGFVIESVSAGNLTWSIIKW